MNISDMDVSYHADWQNIEAESIPMHLDRFAAAGAKKIVVGTHLIGRMMNEPKFPAAFRDMVESRGMILEGCHAPFDDHGLNTPDEEHRRRIVAERKRILEVCGELELKVVVNHLSCNAKNFDYSASQAYLFDQAIRSIEELLPAAQKAGLIFALENIPSPSDHADNLIRIFRRFDSEALGCCFDFGHANFFRTIRNCSTAAWPASRIKRWQGFEIRWNDHMLEDLLPYVVATHMHDNDGDDDAHDMPGKGNVDWKHLLALLERAPRFVNPQTEVKIFKHGYSPEELCRTFRELGFRS